MQEGGEHYALMRMNRGSEPEVFGILGSYKAYEEKLLSGVALYILQAQIFILAWRCPGRLYIVKPLPTA